MHFAKDTSRANLKPRNMNFAQPRKLAEPYTTTPFTGHRSLAGIIPECSLLCYMGSLATDLTQVISGDAGPKGSLTYVLAGITLVLLICSATWATIFVR